MDWQRDIRDFETWLRLEKGLADNSVEAYLRDVGQMRRFMEDQGVEPEAVTLEHLQLLLGQLNDMGIAPASQRRMIAGWRMFYKHLVVEDAMKDSPATMCLQLSFM